MPEAPARGLVLVTRPEPGAGATARRLREMGRAALVAPVLEIGPTGVALPAPDGVQAVLVTSGNALPALAGHVGCRLLAVGDATAARARAAGFAMVLSAGADARALARLAGARCDPAGLPLLLASGAGQGAALAAALRAQGFAVLHHDVYAARPVAVLPAAAVAALGAGRVAVALFFSAASARAFVALLGAVLPAASVAGVEALAISPGTAEALAPLPWRRIRVASAPNQDAILALMV